jgi:hypothetical protein
MASLGVEGPGVVSRDSYRKCGSALYCPMEKLGKETCLVGRFWKIPTPKGDGVYGLVCQLRWWWKGEKTVRRDGEGRRGEGIEVTAPSFGTGVSKLVGHAVWMETALFDGQVRKASDAGGNGPNSATPPLDRTRVALASDVLPVWRRRRSLM